MELWNPLRKSEILTELFLAEQNLDSSLEIFWNKIKISPTIWKCIDVIEENFWVVAKANQYIIWYNDIEEGFNISTYKIDGEIHQYGASKHELQFALQRLISIL